jgi:tyrosinase
MTNGAFVRRDIWALEQGADDPPWDPYTLGYARAIAAMREREPDDPTGWSYQAALHGTYRRPADPLWNGCQHGSWFFLPWHRIYIWYFEREPEARRKVRSSRSACSRSAPFRPRGARSSRRG